MKIELSFIPNELLKKLKKCLNHRLKGLKDYADLAISNELNLWNLLHLCYRQKIV